MDPSSPPAARAESNYDAIAPYYDLWTEMAHATKADVAFYLGQAARDAGGSTIVELGVGTGRVAVPIAQAGHQVIGVDMSAEMLKRAEIRAAARGAAARLHLVRADFTRWRPDVPVRLVTMPYHSLAHIVDPRARRATFANIADWLEPGGCFAFNLAGPAAAEGVPRGPADQLAALPFHDHGLLQVDDTVASVRTRTIIDPCDQVAYAEVAGELRRTAGDLVATAGWTMALAQISPAEIEAYATEFGLTIELRSGAFDAVVPITAEQVWVLRKSTEARS